MQYEQSIQPKWLSLSNKIAKNQCVFTLFLSKIYDKDNAMMDWNIGVKVIDTKMTKQ